MLKLLVVASISYTSYTVEYVSQIAVYAAYSMRLQNVVSINME